MTNNIDEERSVFNYEGFADYINHFIGAVSVLGGTKNDQSGRTNSFYEKCILCS